MHLAKILLKMENKVRAQLPKWFEGTVYELGDEVRNPFSGETVLLDAAELSMYNSIKAAEMVLHMGIAADHCIDVINQGKDWMLAKNPQAYMTLLD